MWFCESLTLFLLFLCLLSFSRRKFHYKPPSRPAGNSSIRSQQPGTEIQRDMFCGTSLSSRVISTSQNEEFTMLSPANYQTQIAQKSPRNSVSDSIVQQNIENISVPVTGEPQWQTWEQHLPISCSSYPSAFPSSSGFSQMPKTQINHIREMGFSDGAGTFPLPYNLPQVYRPSYLKLLAPRTPSTSETSEIGLMRQPLDRTSTNITMAEIDPYGVDTQPMYTFPPERHAICSVDGPVQQVEHGKRETCNCSRMRPNINSCFCSRPVPLSPADRQIDHKEGPTITSTVPAMSSAPFSQQDIPLQEVPVAHPLIPAAARSPVIWDTAKIGPRFFHKFNNPCTTSTRLHAPDCSPPVPFNTPIKVTPFENATSCLSCAKHESCFVHTRAEAPLPRKKRKWGGEEEASSEEHNELYTDNRTIHTPVYTSSYEFGSNQDKTVTAASQKRKFREKRIGLEEDKLPTLSVEEKHSLSHGANDELASRRSIISPSRMRAEDLFPLVHASLAAEPASNDTNVGDNRDQINLVTIMSVSEGVKLKRRRGQQRQASQPLFEFAGQSVPPEADPVDSAMSFVAPSGSITHLNPKVHKKLATTTLTATPLREASQPLLQFTGQSMPPPDLVGLETLPPSVAAPRSITHPHPKVQKKPVTATLTPAPLQRGKNGVPTPIPDEMRALINAYVQCIPVGVFATEAQIKGFWGLDLARKEEFGCSFMGFYRISRVWERLEEEKASIGTSGAEFREPGQGEDTITGDVRWKFRMKWEPGGEDWQTVRRDDLFSPWWNPSLKALKAKGLSGVSQPELDDSDEESTEAYRSARRKNPNFARRHCSFSQTFLSVLPLHLLAPVDVEMPDSSLPKGWYCQDCGKLNFRYYLRHRQCHSSYCQVRGVISLEIETDQSKLSA